MSETERAEAVKAVQLRLFELSVERRELKRAYLQLVSTGKKRCRKRMECESRGEEMDVEQFYVDGRYSDKRYPYCRECKIKMVKARQRKAA